MQGILAAAGETRVPRKPYSSAPIVEAVIELQFKSAISFEATERAARKLEPNYFSNEVDIDIRTEITPALGQFRAEQTPVGHRLTSLDRSEILLIRTTAVAFGQLAPYPGWDKFIERAKRDFRRADRAMGNIQAGRLGVRFINRIDVPFTVADPGDVAVVLRYLPSGPDVGGRTNGFTMQIERDLGEDQCLYKLTTAMVESPVPEAWSLLLDIDVIRMLDIPKRADDLWALLGRMRIHKNTIFEASITDAARELFV